MSPAELIAALEAATGPNEKLDASIAESMGRTVEWHWDHSGQPGSQYPVWLTASGGELVPSFTASIDAALTLVPEGHSVVLCLHADGSAIACANPADGYGEDADGDTPALAICIAAMKALSV